jgi:serine/threonine-protein kinase
VVGRPPDSRADVYSIGVMLFQMLAGDVPFKANAIPAIMKKHLTEDVPTFSSRGVSVPPQIEAVSATRSKKSRSSARLRPRSF